MIYQGMKFAWMALLVSLFYACNCNSKTKGMETINDQRTDTIFPKGEKITNDYFTGTAWLEMLVAEDSVYNCPVANVTFEPGCRNNWHKHPGGQILLVTSGEGYFQEKGKAIQLLKTGDVVRIAPNVEHWHGATPESMFTHLAISTNVQLGIVEWLQPVTDEEYQMGRKD